jgi:capsular exopolysaccharide synthesis family protein
METNNKQTFNAPEIKLHFLDYWRIIRIRKTVILAVFLLVALTTTLVTFILPESFSSTVRIAVEKEASDIAPLDGRSITPGYDPYFIQDQYEKIQSKSVLYPVISNMNLNLKWAAKYKEDRLQMDVTYLILKQKIDVRQSRNTSLIEIRVYSEDKKEAADIANQIADTYRDTRIALKKWNTLRGIETLQVEWDKADGEVRTYQTNVNHLREELQISDPDPTSSSTAPMPTLEPESLRKLDTQRIEAQARYEGLHTLYTNLISLSREDFKKAIQTAAPDQHLATLMEKLTEAEITLANKIADYSDKHPEVTRIRDIIKTLETETEARLDGIQVGLKARVASQKAELNALSAAVDEAKTKDIDTASRNAKYWMAKADLQSAKMVRERLKLRIIQEKIDLAIQKTAIVETVDKAEPGLRPVRPNKPLNIALGIIVGLVVGIGLAFFIEYLDTSVKTIDDVERALQAPVLGVIPQNVGSLLDEGPDSPHAEAYRVLRTNMLFSRKDPKLNTITIVSGGAGEGKSTTLFNLSTVFAQNGQRVLIVDSDLRRPSIHKYLKISNTLGLTNYLLKQNTLEEVIQTTSLPTLDFLPSGKLPSSSLGILSSAQMKELIREVKRRYDFVFFDSPPIMGVSDASILASEVDMVLQVIQYRRYPQPMTIRAKQMIEKVGGNLLGIVLNNINVSQDENYYYYSGYYYDYYSKRNYDGSYGSYDSGKRSYDEPRGSYDEPRSYDEPLRAGSAGKKDKEKEKDKDEKDATKPEIKPKF